MAQLVEWLLQTSEIRGSNPDIGTVSPTNCALEKTKIKKKRSGMATLSKKVQRSKEYTSTASGL